MIKNILAAAAFGVLFTAGGVAVAQTPVVVNSDRAGLYIGANVGRSFQQNSDVLVGLQAGYQLNRNFRVEVTYEHMWNDGNIRNFNSVFVNGILQQRIPSTTVTPYVLGGLGLEFNEFRGAVSDGQYRGVYNVGAGFRVGIANNLELDARYRYVAPVTSRGDTVRGSVTTLGLVYRF
jgi:opacity protein-like surface antigen